MVYDEDGTINVAVGYQNVFFISNHFGVPLFHSSRILLTTYFHLSIYVFFKLYFLKIYV